MEELGGAVLEGSQADSSVSFGTSRLNIPVVTFIKEFYSDRQRKDLETQTRDCTFLLRSFFLVFIPLLGLPLFP